MMRRPREGARFWASGVVAILVVACGSSPAPSPTTPRREVAPAIDAEVDGPVLGTKAPSPQRVWLEPPVVVGRVFFADELEPLTDAIAEVLGDVDAGRFEVTSPSELRTLQKQLRAGQVPGVEGRCEVVPPPMVLYSHLNADVASADVRVECGDDCELTVEVEASDEDGSAMRDEPTRFSARLPARGTVEEWVASLRKGGLDAARRESRAGGLGIMTGHTSGLAKGHYDVQVSDVVTEGTWPTALDAVLLKPHARALHDCEKQGGPRRDAWQQPFVIEVGETGKVQRCEAKYQHRLDPPGFACRCQVLSRASFGKAAAGRRAQLGLRTFLGGELDAASGYTTSVTMQLKSTDPSAMFAMGSLDMDEIRSCLAAARQPMEVEVPLSVVVGADGKVAHSTVDWPSSLAPGVKTCLSRTVAAARFSCPLSGESTVSGSMTLTIRKAR